MTTKYTIQTKDENDQDIIVNLELSNNVGKNQTKYKAELFDSKKRYYANENYNNQLPFEYYNDLAKNNKLNIIYIDSSTIALDRTGWGSFELDEIDEITDNNEQLHLMELEEIIELEKNKLNELYKQATKLEMRYPTVMQYGVDEILFKS